MKDIVIVFQTVDDDGIVSMVGNCVMQCDDDCNITYDDAVRIAKGDSKNKVIITNIIEMKAGE